ncbi:MULTISPECIES: nucleotide disphospho-sugar-binding domain-containing protein [unclassified Streptomyces]|uniref:nucleotide disphospho-sugar-binding domain-containing protein n=1 Tax=unclassified Streptomyces TaxID=2593676 RepID=UPI0033BF8783
MLFVAAGSPATVFALAPLATAARNAGHQVVMAANDDMVPVITSSGLPGIATTDLPIRHFITLDRAGNPEEIPSDPIEQARFTGRWFARMAASSLPRMLEFCRAWRPDLIVGGTMSYVAPLLALHLGVPHVRQTWDAIEADGIHPGADTELSPELAEFGLGRLPDPDVFVDICPPSLRPEGAAPARRMRYVPANGQRRLEPWMYRRGERRRVLVTSGSRVAKESYDKNFEFLRGLAKDVAAWDVELIVAAPDEVADALRDELPDVRAGWVPLDVVAPTCDLLVHHGGGVSTLTGLNAGVPQLLIPKGAVLEKPALRVADLGAALTLLPGEDSADAIADCCQELLSDDEYRDRARGLSREIAAMPSPASVLDALEQA